MSQHEPEESMEYLCSVRVMLMVGVSTPKCLLRMLQNPPERCAEGARGLRNVMSRGYHPETALRIGHESRHGRSRIKGLNDQGSKLIIVGNCGHQR